MNKEEIITFIKKNIISISCGIVAIVAVALLFYPLGGFNDSLQDEAKSHAEAYQSLAGYIKQRKLPMNDPNQVDPGTLAGFPNASTVKEGNDAVTRFKTASDDMLMKAVQLNQKGHTPLVPDVLPRNKLDSSPIHFGEAYKLVLSADPSVHGVSDTTAVPPITADPTLANYHALNLRNDILHGALPPTQAELQQASNDLWNNSYVPEIITRNGQPMNKQELTARFLAENSHLPQKIKMQVATQHKIYVESDAFSINPQISSTSGSPSEMIWYAQMELWMQQDLANAIAEANSKSSNILDAEVKRLISIQLPTPPAIYTFPPAGASMPGGGGGGAGGGGAGVGGASNMPSTADDKSAIPPIYTVSPTGRYSNGMYDVVRFKLVVDVDSARVNQFIQTLSHLRMITVTGESQFALSADAEAARGYLYGPGSAVRLVLDGEELFMRKWTADPDHPLMPESVRIALGILQGKPGVGPGGAYPPPQMH